MHRLTRWQLLGIVLMAAGVWGVTWGVRHWSDPAEPTRVMGSSLQWTRIVVGGFMTAAGVAFFCKKLAP
jgi:hypothetical protein